MKENNILASLILGEKADEAEITENIKELEAQGADGICIYEMSESEAGHEANIHLIKKLCGSTGVPVYAGGNVENLEDVKKFLYAGCSGVVVDSDMPRLLNDAVKRFGNAADTSASQEEIRGDISGDTDVSWESLKPNDSGLVPCIVQDETDGTVLMMAYMNKESYEATLSTKRMTYYSRSRQKLWIKGEESGHFQYMRSLTADCDRDTLLAVVKQVGPACHTGLRSCFFNNISGKAPIPSGSGDVLTDVYNIILDRRDHPKEGSYTNYLFDKGIDKVLKKVGEESTEIIIAAKNPEREEIIYEISDFLYHVSVLMAMKGVTWQEIIRELENR